MRSIGRTALAAMMAAGALPATAQQPQNDALARLQRTQAANPSSVAANRALGIWYYKANRYAEARVPLDMAHKLDPRDGVSALYDGLAAEQLKDYAAARAAYNDYLTVGKTRGARNEIRARLVVVTQEELKAGAAAAVANEAQLAQQAPVPNTVAVLPFRFSGTDASLQPLERGMADLVVTDLSKSHLLRVLERDRAQAMTDEIALSRTGQVDAATAVRAGKLMQAERLVQGAIVQTGGRNINLTSAVLSTQTSAQVGQADQQGDLEQIFAVEKAFVMKVFTALGVALTPAERQEVDRRSTQSLAAFLAYSRGLQAQDAGRFDEAAGFFDNARSLDPGFGAALQRAQSNSAAQQSSTARVESGIRGSSEGAIAVAAERGATTTTTTTGLGVTLNTVIGDVNPTTTNTVTNNTGGSSSAAPATRDPAAEKTGGDLPNVRIGSVTIIIKRP